jgi:hypothetical protein
MPPNTHAFLATLLRESPALVLRLLALVRDELPPGAVLEPLPARFWGEPARHPPPDVACLIKDAAGALLSPLAVQIALAASPEAKHTWFLHVATLFATFKRPCRFLVLALDPDTERWAAEPHIIDHAPSVFFPTVIGPSLIPRITDIPQAKQFPELAVLSALAHPRGPGAATIAFAALAACENRDTPASRRYADFVSDWLDENTSPFP